MPKVLNSISRAVSTICLIALSFVYKDAKAETVPHLYRAVVPVASQSESDRDSGFQLALEQVLVKVTGQEDRVQEEGIAARFSSPVKLVQSFSYRENPEWLNFQESLKNSPALSNDPAAESADQNVEREPPPPPEHYLLEADFAPASINQKLGELAVPVWGQVRPSVLVWAALEKKGERTLIGNGDAFGFAHALRLQSLLRGLPMYLPSADLQDLVAINLEELFGLFPDAVVEGNQRYRPDAHVMLRIYQTGDSDAGEEKWNANWTIFLKREAVTGERLGVSFDEALAGMSRQLASYLASRYAVLKSGSEDGAARSTLRFEVDQVNSLDDFVKLQQHLESLPPLSGLDLIRVSGSKVICDLHLQGTQEQLMEHLELSGLLREKVVEEAYPSPDDYFNPERLLNRPSIDLNFDSQENLEVPPILQFDWLGKAP